MVAFRKLTGKTCKVGVEIWKPVQQSVWEGSSKFCNLWNFAGENDLVHTCAKASLKLEMLPAQPEIESAPHLCGKGQGD